MSRTLDHLGARIKELRRAKGFSQRQLGDLAGVPQAHISRIESGAVDLRLSSIAAIADALDHEFAVIPHRHRPPAPSPRPGRERGQQPRGLLPKELDYNG